MAIVATVFISVFAFGATAYGSDNDVPFLVQVPGNQKKGYSKAEYRGSSGPEVPWKVDFTFSEEGRGTIMYFYLSGPWYEKVSDVKSVKQGTGCKYFAAYDSAQNMLDLLLRTITRKIAISIMLQVIGMKKQINTNFHTNKFCCF